MVGAARNPNINIEIWDISEFRYPMGKILIGLYELHVLKALTITELEDWRVPKPDPDPCVEYTEDVEGAMLIPETTHEKERDEILAKEKTLSMYLDICSCIDLCLEIVSSRPEEHVEEAETRRVELRQFTHSENLGPRIHLRSPPRTQRILTFVANAPRHFYLPTNSMYP